MNLKRLATLLAVSGIVFIAGGFLVWALRQPTQDWLKEGYYQCLWSSSYKATSDIKPDLINPAWNPEKASCATASQDSIINYAEESRRRITHITTGIDPGKLGPQQPPLFATPPFLNAAGVILFLLGMVIEFSRSREVTSDSTHPNVPLFDQQRWNALVAYDDDIKRIVEALSPYGPKYIDQFSKAYMALNDKQYLPQIVQDILTTARADNLKKPNQSV
jgi:hypothetical protein